MTAQMRTQPRAEETMAKDRAADPIDPDPPVAEDAPLRDFDLALDRQHHARFERRGPRLLVAFAGVHGRGDLDGHRPALDALADDVDWSVLSLAARGDTWFRTPAVIAFFDRLVDTAFLDRFDDVLFQGTGPGGHAALSYAVCAPLSRVLAVAPQVTLAPGAADWDMRFDPDPALDFDSRYPATEAPETADRVYLVYDPLSDEDARHAALLDGETVVRLRVPLLMPEIEATLTELDMLDPTAVAAMEGTLDRLSFAQGFRVRRDSPMYIRRLVKRLSEDGHDRRAAVVLGNFARRSGNRRFQKRFERLRDELAERGIAV
ncbi:phosphoadenosine phosphosulfate reductase [Rhodobacteraceae bacterium CCMM004]|nr:phosphoadenosine phosphosulfate reductase [Rhodobacteraceae bacterium CCMM004]